MKTLIALFAALPLFAQTVTLNPLSTIQANPNRIGIHNAPGDFYDAGIIWKNLTFSVGAFEGSVYQQVIHCTGGTTTTCLSSGNNQYDGVFAQTAVSACTVSGRTATCTVPSSSKFSTGMGITIAGMTPGALNVTGAILSVPSGTTFTIAVPLGTGNSTVAGHINAFWAGATFRMFAGTSANLACTGTITGNTAASGSNGPTYTLGTACPSAIALGDYMDIRQVVNVIPTNGGGSWALSNSNNGVFGQESSDLPSGIVGGSLAGVYDAGAAINSKVETDWYQDTGGGHNYLMLTGTYTASIWLKLASGSTTMTFSANRLSAGGGSLSCNPTAWSLTASWAQYTATCTVAETVSTPVSNIKFSLITSGKGVVYAKGLSFQKTSPVDSTNTSIYRDEVIATHRILNNNSVPGTPTPPYTSIRFWDGQLGETLDNWITTPLGRRGSAYNLSSYAGGAIQQGLYDSLVLAEAVGNASPWIVFPLGFTAAEGQNMMDFICGTTATTYGAKRSALGHAATFCSTLPHIYLEFGNEPWNGAFTGGSMDNTGDGFNYTRYGASANVVLGAMKGQAAYTSNSSAFSLVIGCQCIPWGSGGGNCSGAANLDAYHDAIGFSEYNPNGSGSPGYNSMGTLAAEWNPDTAFSWQSGDDTTNGVWASNNYNLLHGGVTRPVPAWNYEFNANDSTFTSPVTQAQVATHMGAAMQAATVLSGAMERLKNGNDVQNLFDLGQSRYDNLPIWGSILDIGGQWAAGLGATFAARPSGLALQLANASIIGPMYAATVASSPTYSASANNNLNVAASGVPSLFCYAFKAASGGNSRSVLCINTDPVNPVTVTFAGAAPRNGVTQRTLSFSGVDSTNETTHSNVSIATTTITAPSSITLPAGGITALDWQVAGRPTIVGAGVLFGSSVVIE